MAPGNHRTVTGPGPVTGATSLNLGRHCHSVNNRLGPFSGRFAAGSGPVPPAVAPRNAQRPRGAVRSKPVSFSGPTHAVLELRSPRAECSAPGAPPPPGRGDALQSLTQLRSPGDPVLRWPRGLTPRAPRRLGSGRPRPPVTAGPSGFDPLGSGAAGCTCNRTEDHPARGPTKGQGRISDPQACPHTFSDVPNPSPARGELSTTSPTTRRSPRVRNEVTGMTVRPTGRAGSRTRRSRG